MTEIQTSAKAPKAAKSLDDEINAAREKLRKLEEKQRETKKKERERNIKAVYELLKDEKLDAVSIEEWKRALPQLKKALLPSGAAQAAAVESDLKAA